MIKHPLRLNRQHVHGATCSESEHQISLIQWVRETEELQTDDDIREALHFFHSIPNGGGRGKPFITRRGYRLPPLQAVQMKAEGVVPGVFDLRLDLVRYETREDPTEDYPDVESYGLIAEMKKAGEYLSPDQKRYKQFMESQGFKCCIWYTWQAGARAVTEYMRLERIAPVFVQIEGQRYRSITTPHQLLSETF